MVASPYESYDRLICTSRAVVNMAKSVTDTYAEFLSQRYGGHPALRPKLELIPLGVDTDTYCPAVSTERIAERGRWKISADEIAVLFVGRLSHHAKAHPFPMFAGLATAAAQTNTRVHLLLAGWAASPAIQQAFAQGAQTIAPNVRCPFIDGVDPKNRFSVWRAADIFTSLSDNIQETFGLVIAEAMACGLRVVATDWNGYRDLVVDGVSGILVPTTMVRDATSDVTVQLMLGEVNYDHFLAQCNQAVAVDVGATAAAFATLIRDADLRRRMGVAGRKRAVEHFDWKHIVAAYESLWEVQAVELAAARKSGATASHATPSLYPPPESSFAGYPTKWLCDQDRVRTSPEAAARLELMAALPLTNYEGGRRLPLAAIKELLLLAVGGCTLAELDEIANHHGASRLMSRATIAWLLKYGMLDPVEHK
jgi:glycosyltransferase involved in cell wall biosynthesis